MIYYISISIWHALLRGAFASLKIELGKAEHIELT